MLKVVTIVAWQKDHGNMILVIRWMIIFEWL
jgi:hypothetical protein